MLVFLPGKSRGQRSLMGYSPWDYEGSTTTKQLITQEKKKKILKHTILSLILI